MLTCPTCGTPNPERAKFCFNCGSKLAEETGVAREARKTVTIVFSDVTGSTALGEHLDPESLRRVMTRYFDEMRAVLSRHGGTVEKFIGDAVMAVFGIPELHEDDALRATRAALEMRDRLEQLNAELETSWGVRLQVRTGVNTGEVVAGDPSTGQNLVTGDAVNTAARLEQHASPGEILLGPTTHRLVRDAVFVEGVEPLAVKGKAEPVAAVRLVDVVPGASGHTRRLDARLVGREQELRLFLWAFSRVLHERTCHLFTVLGPAGVGKSRLIAEATKAIGNRAMVFSAECPAYGESLAFRPMADALREAVGYRDDMTQEEALARVSDVLGDTDQGVQVATRLAPLVGRGDGTPVPIDETAWAIRRLLEALARRRPVVIVLDDLHWAEPSLLDLIDHVVDWSRDAPILVICAARPELLDSRPSWGGGKMNATSLSLEPLTEPESAQLLENLLDSAELADPVRARITDAAEGNPLFMEEMLAMLLDDGLLKWEDGCWRPTLDLEGVSVPPTIQALLASRLDRLLPAEHKVLERASVIGKVFERDALGCLDAAPDDESLRTTLRTLARKDLIRGMRSDGPPGSETYTFRHRLIRDAAYDSLPKQDRADLHERFALCMEAPEGRLPFSDEVLGFHLEQAARYRQELGPLDDRGRDLARHAAARLTGAGRRALAEEDMAAAATLLRRAVDVVSSFEQPSPEVLAALGAALDGAGDLPGATDVLERAAELATAAGDDRLEANLSVQRLHVQLHAAPASALSVVDAAAEKAIEVLEAIGDERGLARAWALVANVRWTRCQVAACEEATQKAVAHARAAGDMSLAAASLGTLPSVALYGPTPLADGIRSCEEILVMVADRPSLQSRALRALGVMRAMQGDIDEGRSLIARSRAIVEDLGWTFYIAGCDQALGIVEQLGGDLSASEAAFRRSYDLLRGAGDTSYMSTAAGMLAHVLHDLGRDDEAFEMTQITEEAAAEDDIDSQMSWRTARAAVLVTRGELDEAGRLVGEAIRMAEETDLLMTADRRVEAGLVLAAAGREAEGAALLERALAQFEHKGDRVSAERARERLAELRSGARSAPAS